MRRSDTIAALATAEGHAPRMIVRLAGRGTFGVLRQLGIEPAVGASDATLKIDDLPVSALVLVFAAPRSYTGEDAAELHLPGNAILAEMVLRALWAAGARPAEPGEFTARAYLNGKLSLAAAEGVAAAIVAEGAADLRAARQLMAGALADRLRPTMRQLVETLALVEAGIDFAEEDISFLDTDDLATRLAGLANDLRQLLADAPRLGQPRQRPRIVLAGRPNAGKSTLFNALVGQARAVVSPAAGTTRDVLSEMALLPGGLVELVDAAGLEDAAPSRDIERQMRAHAERAAAEADVLVLIREVGDARPDVALPAAPDVVVVTKADAGGDGVSAHTGRGMGELRQTLGGLAFGRPFGGLALNARHVAELAVAVEALGQAAGAADEPELAAADVRRALDHLGLVLGEVTPDDVLGEVFGRFCVGK